MPSSSSCFCAADSAALWAWRLAVDQVLLAVAGEGVVRGVGADLDDRGETEGGQQDTDHDLFAGRPEQGVAQPLEPGLLGLGVDPVVRVVVGWIVGPAVEPVGELVRHGRRTA